MSISKLAHAKHFASRQSPTLNQGCRDGSFYKSPKPGDNIDTSQDIKIEWDTSLDCFNTQGVDIYLYAPYAAKSMIRGWGGVSYSQGTFETSLAGSWWNSSTAPIQLQLAFTVSGTHIFSSKVPAGPLFTSTFNATDFAAKNPTGAASNSTSTSTSSASSGGGIFQIIGNAWKNAGLPKGSIVAAVLVPLIAIGIGLAIYVKFQRAKEAERRKRWSQAVDKRMSAISTEWKGLPPGAQSEAIRQSIAIMRDSRASMARMSQLYEARPVSSTLPADGGQAGVGARKGTGVGPRHASPANAAARLSERKSAISFAASTKFDRPERPSADSMPLPVPRPSGDRMRPSGETQRGRASRAFHTAISTDDLTEHMDDLMSPAQVGGPAILGDGDVMPALAMMHQQTLKPHADDDDSGDFLMLDRSPMSATISVTPPSAALLTPATAVPFTPTTPPSPAYGTTAPRTPTTPTSNYNNTHGTNPFAGFMRGPSNVMSPDAMLAAYASRTPTTPTHTHTTVYPALDAPVRAERTVYTPVNRSASKGSARSRYSGNEEDAYGGYGRAT